MQQAGGLAVPDSATRSIRRSVTQRHSFSFSSSFSSSLLSFAWLQFVRNFAPLAVPVDICENFTDWQGVIYERGDSERERKRKQKKKKHPSGPPQYTSPTYYITQYLQYLLGSSVVEQRN